MGSEGHRTVVVLVDYERGEIAHMVAYESVDGALVRIVGSSDFGPFDDYTARLQWLLRTLRWEVVAPPS